MKFYTVEGVEIEPSKELLDHLKILRQTLHHAKKVHPDLYHDLYTEDVHKVIFENDSISAEEYSRMVSVMKICSEKKPQVYEALYQDGPDCPTCGEQVVDDDLVAFT